MRLFLSMLFVLCLSITEAENTRMETIPSKNAAETIRYNTPEYFSARYERVYSLLRNGNGDNSDRVLVFQPNPWGGFANSFRGLFSTALCALVNGKRLRVDWRSYSKVMSESLSFLKTEDYNIHHCDYNSDDDPHNFMRVNAKQNECIIASSYLDFIDTQLKINGAGKKLVDLGLFDDEPKPIQVRQLLSRALFRLNDELLTKSDNVFQEIRNRTSIGVQIRTGGKMANAKEDTIFFSPDKMYRVYAILNSLIEGIKDDVVIYLSTDSNRVVALLKNELHVPIVVAKYYKPSHSTLLRSEDHVQGLYRGVIDLKVLSQCDYLLTTFTSSFGNLASYLSHSLNKVIMSYKD